jgi:hypothetical protein
VLETESREGGDHHSPLVMTGSVVRILGTVYKFSAARARKRPAFFVLDRSHFGQLSKDYRGIERGSQSHRAEDGRHPCDFKVVLHIKRSASMAQARQPGHSRDSVSISAIRAFLPYALYEDTVNTE